MKRDYRKALEKAARQMIIVHRTDTLIRLILRTILRTLGVNHAGILLYDKERGEYIVRVSRGKKGIKVPAGFAKLTAKSPLIRYFTDKSFTIFSKDFLLYSKINYYIRFCKTQGRNELIGFLEELKDSLSLFGAKACVPGFFRNTLVGVLFLGDKQDKSGFKPEELGFLSVLASDVVMAIQNAWLFEDINEQLTTNKRLFLSTVTSLAAAIEAKDQYTKGHTDRVVKYSLAIVDTIDIDAAVIKDDSLFKENLRIAALLHDIGKIGIPEEVLNKNGPLTDDEWQHVAKHPAVGIDILAPIKEFKDIMLGVQYHHERFDGKGYPFKLKGKDIPLIAAIIAVADSFDAMTSDRPYRKAFSKEYAVCEIKDNKAKQFDPDVVDAFLRAYDVGMI